MKLLKRKNFQALIYAIFISLPMLSILPSTIYFAFNHEAANYTHDEVIETYEYETNEVNSVDDLIVGNIYELKLTNYTISDIWNLQYSKTYNKEFTSSGNLQYYNNNVLELFTYTNGRIYYTYDYIDNNYIGFMSSDYYPTINLDIYFVYSNISGSQYLINYISASDYLGEKNVEVIESEMNPMSAFDNAIGKFVSDNDFGRLDFFTFFSSLFLTNSSMNNLYIHFINWYMNYALYVSLAYLLFGVLLYFVNFFRKLVDNSEDTHIGGF